MMTNMLIVEQPFKKTGAHNKVNSIFYNIICAKLFKNYVSLTTLPCIHVSYKEHEHGKRQYYSEWAPAYASLPYNQHIVLEAVGGAELKQKNDTWRVCLTLFPDQGGEPGAGFSPAFQQHVRAFIVHGQV